MKGSKGEGPMKKTGNKGVRILRRAASVLAIAAAVFMMFPLGLPGGDSHASDNTMYTLEYNVTVDVAKDNSYDYHEYLDMYYVTAHHGIYRYIPMQGQKISGIKVPGYHYDTYTQSGYQVVKIGSGDYTLTGENPYDIYYNIAMYEDENSEKDMLLLNLIPTDWETDIGASKCVVTLPKEADLSKAKVYSGSYGTASNEDNAVLETGDDGKTITITASDIPAHHGITLQLELPQGYWEGAPQFGKVSIAQMFLFLLGPVGAFLLWYLFGRDDKLVKTLEFYPPDELTPGEIGYLVDGRADRQSYRLFKMKRVESQDDYQSMRETLERRFSHNEDDGFKYPDIILVDGGKGQLEAVASVVRSMEGTENIYLAGMVKNDRHKTAGIVFEDGREIRLEGRTLTDSEMGLLRFLTTVQNEVHRFAISYQHKLAGKRNIRYKLENIEGIGPAKRKNLLSHFGTIKAVENASEEELREAKGISEKDAKAIYQYFH